MRRPLRNAMLGFGLALVGALLGVVAFGHGEALGPALAIPLGAIALPLGAIGFLFGILGLLAGIGEARLRRGIGVIERWEVPPATWEAFRGFDARRGDALPGILREFTPRPAEGRPVEVVFGRRQVLLDGSYHALRREAVPTLEEVGWLRPDDAPECLEFWLIQSRGRHGGGAARLAMRVPVPHAEREAGVRVYRHFHALLPEDRRALPFRRPGLVAASGGGIGAAALLAAFGGSALQAAGHEGAGNVLLIGGIAAAAVAWLVTALLLLAALLHRRQSGSPPSRTEG